MSNHPDNGDTKETNDTAVPTSVAPKPNPSITDTDELEGLKIVMLDSAELATRSANLAVGAGEQIKKNRPQPRFGHPVSKEASAHLDGHLGRVADHRCNHFCHHDFQS